MRMTIMIEIVKMTMDRREILRVNGLMIGIYNIG